jgi:hypothetical protein
MEAHECNQERVIGEMHSLLKTMVKQVYGNGQPGLAAQFPALQNSVETLTTTVAAQTNVIADLIKFQEGLKSVDDYKDKQGMSSRARAAIWVSGIIGFSAIATTLIVKFA